MSSLACADGLVPVLVALAAPHQVFKLTHDLSYLYFKATKSVSIVPPVYYADIIGNRARNYFAHESLEEYQQRPYNPVHSNVQQLSFFC